LFNDLDENIPETLIFFVEKLLLKNNKENLESKKRVYKTICHMIMYALRLRSFRSPLQLGLAVYCHRQYASQRLVDILLSLGVSNKV